MKFLQHYFLKVLFLFSNNYFTKKKPDVSHIVIWEHLDKANTYQLGMSDLIIKKIKAGSRSSTVIASAASVMYQ